MAKENYQQNLPAILSNWGLQPLAWEKIKDVYKVYTNQGVKNLKVSTLNPSRLAFVHQTVNHLWQNGFSNMYPLIPTLAGANYVSDQQYAYTLFDWIEGRQCDFGNTRELTESTRILAEFHCKSLNFTPPANSNMRNQLGKSLRNYEKHYQNLLDYEEQAHKRPDDPFAQAYLENIGFFLPMAATAIQKLKNSAYPELVNRAKAQKPVCHGDPAARNFIYSSAGSIYMIDFDSCRLDLPIMDLVKFARRVLKKYQWSFEVARLIVDSYQEVNPIDQAELEVIKAVFYFPQKFWRMATRYFQLQETHNPERELAKFKKFLRNKEAFARFQVEFEDYKLSLLR